MFWLWRLREFVRQSDWWLFISPVLIIVLSLTVLYSISAVRSGGDLSIFKKQLIIAAAGLLVALVVSAVNYRAWQSLSLVIYLGTIVLLVLVLIFGYRVHATRGWIGFGFFRFQPVEFAKLAMVIVLAHFFSLPPP